MAKKNKPTPKNQREISQGYIDPYLEERGKAIVETRMNRGTKNAADDNVKDIAIGIQDVDEALIYYFDNVIKPSVMKSGERISVPTLYASPERWKSVQKDGFYRDKNGKIQLPLIMFRRDNIVLNRGMGNKLDGNEANNYIIYKKKFSKRNIYDKFSILTNRSPVDEYYAVVVPNYVTLEYTCTIFTDTVEQINPIIESIIYASDSYWGDKNRFQFRARIDSVNTITELNQGEDRGAKSTFILYLHGYIIPDSINKELSTIRKFRSRSRINIRMEAVGSIEELWVKGSTPENEAKVRFFDVTQAGGGSGELSPAQVTYIGLNSTALADIISPPNTAIFSNKTIASPPSGFSVSQDDFQVYINGVFIPTDFRFVSQDGTDMKVVFSDLAYPLDSEDQVFISGKFT